MASRRLRAALTSGVQQVFGMAVVFTEKPVTLADVNAYLDERGVATHAPRRAGGDAVAADHRTRQDRQEGDRGADDGQRLSELCRTHLLGVGMRHDAEVQSWDAVEITGIAREQRQPIRDGRRCDERIVGAGRFLAPFSPPATPPLHTSPNSPFLR